MLKLTIELPETATLFNVEGGESFKIDFAKLVASGKAESFFGGASGAIVRALRIPAQNAYNSGGKDATKAERAAKARKRIESWEAGEWAIVERGESEYSAMREVWIDDYRARTNATQKEAESLIRAKVEERLGKDSKATFSNFLDASALELVEAKAAKDTHAARAMLESHLSGLVAERDKARAKAESKVVVPAFDLASFKK